MQLLNKSFWQERLDDSWYCNQQDRWVLLYSILVNWLWQTSKATWGYARQMSTRCFKEDKATVTGVREWTKSHRAWYQWTEGKATGLRALVKCIKIKGVWGVWTLGCPCASPCFRGSKRPMTPQRIQTETKLKPQQEVRVSPLYWTKGPSIITEGEKGDTHTHTQKKECMVNQTWEKKTQITLNWCSVGVTDKGFHKKKEWDQAKNATGVKASSHGYWTGYNGEVHEEKSLIQAEVHFTVVLALKVWDWEPFHSQRHLASGQKFLWSRARISAMTWVSRGIEHNHYCH